MNHILGPWSQSHQMRPMTNDRQHAAVVDRLLGLFNVSASTLRSAAVPSHMGIVPCTPHDRHRLPSTEDALEFRMRGCIFEGELVTY